MSTYPGIKEAKDLKVGDIIFVVGIGDCKILLLTPGQWTVEVVVQTREAGQKVFTVERDEEVLLSSAYPRDRIEARLKELYAERQTLVKELEDLILEERPETPQKYVAVYAEHFAKELETGA
jgi:hypothetical protein